jgi:hypothetical protein
MESAANGQMGLRASPAEIKNNDKKVPGIVGE